MQGKHGRRHHDRAGGDGAEPAAFFVVQWKIRTKVDAYNGWSRLDLQFFGQFVSVSIKFNPKPVYIRNEKRKILENRISAGLV